jgi:hypothetical protein
MALIGRRFGARRNAVAVAATCSRYFLVGHFISGGSVLVTFVLDIFFLGSLGRIGYVMVCFVIVCIVII